MSTATALELSDEEFLQQPVPDFEEEAQVDENTETVAEDPATEDVPEEESEGDSEAQEQPELETEEEEVSQPEGDTQTEHETDSESDETESLDTSDTDQTDTDGDTQETNELDYESAYKKVTAPFKANGIEMQVDNPDDVIKLMQMGANYQKKMKQMKPNLKLVKMLENNGLLDEAKINNLIDISNKNPAALAKLLKDSGIDPLDIDTDKVGEYSPTDHSVSDKEYDLDSVLESIKDTPTFNQTIDVMSKEWDGESKKLVSDNPEIIEVINTHMQNGVYEKINSLVQKEKLLGNLQGVPDVVAYRQAAEFLAQNGQLVDSTAVAKDPVSSEPAKPAVGSKKRDAKRKAAAPAKKTAPAKKKADEDFLGLSDEDFMKKFGT